MIETGANTRQKHPAKTSTPPIVKDSATNEVARQKVKGSSEVSKVMTEAEAAKALRKVHKNLHEYYESGIVPDTSLGTTEREVDKNLMRDTRRNMRGQEVAVKNQYSNFSTDDIHTLMWQTLTTFGVLSPLVSWGFGLDIFFILLFLMLGSIAGLVVALALGPTGLHPYPYIRNKIIRRKEYKLEVRRIAEENRDYEERYEMLRRNRAKKLERAEKTLKKLAAQHESNNPGKTLALSPNKRRVVEIERAAATPTEILAAKIVNGPAA